MVSVTKHDTPALRFDGFDGEWGAVELQQIADIVGGGTPSTSVTSFWDGDIDWYSPNEIGETAIAKPSNKRITRAGLANSSARLLPAHRTVLFTSRASIGHAAILDHPATTNQGFQSFVLKNGVDAHFIYALTSKITEIAEQLATGSTFLEISNKTVREIEVHVPATEEQRAIGELFADLDALIEQHRAKHANLQQTKTALMQRMFPQDGADEPELRLGGFSGTWEKVQIQQIADVVGGGTPSTSVASFWDGHIDWYSPNEIGEDAIAKPSNKRITSAGLANSSAKMLPAHRTILFTSRASIGHAAILDHPATTNQGFQSFVLKDGVDTHFVYALTPAITQIAEQLATGSTFLEVSNKTVREIEVSVPGLEEQRAIGEVFSNLDALIAAEHRYVTQLTQAKTALLQRMFV